MKYNTNSAFK